MNDLIRKALSGLTGVQYAEARIHRGRATRVAYSGKELACW